jgi:adenylate cyclase
MFAPSGLEVNIVCMEASNTQKNYDDFQSVEVSTLFADLRGFTAISSEYPAEIVIGMLNRFLNVMSEIIVQHGGTVDKFIGDSIMATFGRSQSQSDSLKQTLVCAVQMQLAMDAINQANTELNLPSLHMGIGINTGKVMAGRLGSILYSEQTVIGDSVNVASRIESFSLRGQILIGLDTYEQLKQFVEVSEPIDIFVKGKPQPLIVHEVLGIPSLGLQVPRREARRSDRVRVKMPFCFQKIENKIVSAEMLHGVIIDISYYGIQAELADPISLHSDVKLDIDLSLIGYCAKDIYGKVVKVNENQGKHFAAIQFTSNSLENEIKLREFVQILIQGCEKVS